MSSAKLRRRINAAGEVRRLTDGEARALLDAHKSVRTSVRWTTQDSRFVRMEVSVENPAGENLKLTGLINRSYPGKSSWTLTWGKKIAGEFPESIRRLDLRAKHRNPDGAVWQSETHKHRWSSADGNDWAYTPDDIPHDVAGEVVGPDDYRAIFEAFANECGIDLGTGYTWTDPIVQREAPSAGLWEV